MINYLTGANREKGDTNREKKTQTASEKSPGFDVC